MREYIDREAAIEKTETFCDVFVTKWTDEKVLAWIRNLPSADVAPVVHGRWVWADDGYLRCSECTQKAPVVPQYQDEPITTATSYCPNCGAKMDAEG